MQEVYHGNARFSIGCRSDGTDSHRPFRVEREVESELHSRPWPAITRLAPHPDAQAAMTHPRESDPLRPMLEATESQLAERLEEACSHGGSEETTAELVRLEETLTEAARVAKQAVSLRRRLRTGHGQADPGGHREAHDSRTEADTAVPRRERRSSHPDDRAQVGPDEESAAVREFLDERGMTWRVWAVTQEQLHPERMIADRMGDYRDGWLAFESADESERRRLPHYPPNWLKLSNLDLEGLLRRAEFVRRKRTGPDESESTLA